MVVVFKNMKLKINKMSCLFFVIKFNIKKCIFGFLYFCKPKKKKNLHIKNKKIVAYSVFKYIYVVFVQNVKRMFKHTEIKWRANFITFL